MTESTIDHKGTSELVCPYCGYTHSDSWELTSENGFSECTKCEKNFFYERDIEITYCTKKLK